MIKKYQTFIIFCLIIILWTTLFNAYKYFGFALLDNTTDRGVTLQTITKYLSIGGIFAYLLGGAIAYTFKKGIIILISSLLAIFFLFLTYFLGYPSQLWLIIIATIIGFFYGVWVVVRGVLISIEIEKTGLPDTVVNAIVSILFIGFLIIGAIIGGLLFEKLGTNGTCALILILSIASLLSLFMKYGKYDIECVKNGSTLQYLCEKKDNFKQAMIEYLPNIKFIFKNYTSILISAGFLRTLTTIVSQQIIDHSIKTFEKTNSEAAILLLFSALGAIIGNTISMKMQKYRWKFFEFFTYAFAICVFIIPLVWTTYNSVIIMAVICGIFFGVSSNLIEGYYYKKLGEQDEKEYGASVYGLVLSIVLSVMSLLSDKTEMYLTKEWVFYISGIILVGIAVYMRFSVKNFTTSKK